MAPSKKSVVAASPSASTSATSTTPVEVVVDVSTESVDSATPVVVPDIDIVQARFDALYKDLATVTNATKDIIASLKVLHKDYTKTAKIANKRTRKNTTGVKRVPSGFAKPAKLSDELCDFLAVEKGSELARTSVTRMLNAYIKEHNLQDPSYRRHIIPDEPLSKLMNFDEGKGTLSYFNLQSYIKHHFIKDVPSVAAVEVAAVEPVVVA